MWNDGSVSVNDLKNIDQPTICLYTWKTWILEHFIWYFSVL